MAWERRLLGLVCLVLLLSPGNLAAQSLGHLYGRITDPADAVVAAARVSLTDAKGTIVCERTSDAQGHFDCGSVASGRFTVTAEASPFVPVRAVVEVGSGAPVEVNLQFCQLAPRKQVVTVVASAPPVLNPDPAARVVAHDEVLDANPGRPGAPISIPGLPIETASGGIKAPQYFAPGVAGDHGEPIGQFVQVGSFLYPNNLPANAHGNGYSDPNILITPVLSGVGVDDGAYNVREGDHSVDLAATYQLRPRLSPFAQISADYRDVDFVGGWSPSDPAIHEWIALEASFGNGFLERLEHRRQYKLNGYREIKTERHDISVFGIGYYGFSRIPGLIPIDVTVPDDTVDYRQLDRTHTVLAVVSDTWQLNRATQFMFGGFFRDYDLTLQSNFGDGLIQQRENRTVAGGEGAYLAKLGHGVSLLAGIDLRRDAPRNLDLKHLDEQGLFQLVTSNNFIFGFAEPFVSLEGNLGRHVHFDAGMRQEEISIQNQDLLTPTNSFTTQLSVTLPKATVTFLPPDGTPLPSLSLSGAEAFHTDDPRISTDSGTSSQPNLIPPNLITTSRAYEATLKKEVGNTRVRLVLVRVANSEETANIDPDTGLQMYVGPSVNHALTASVERVFHAGSVEASFSRADAHDRSTGEPVPEAPRLIWDAVGHWDRLPLGLRARGEFEYVGRKPLGDGFTGVPVREVRGAMLRSFGEGRMSLGINFLLASGFSGQTLETLALYTDPAPFERIVGVPMKSYLSLSWTYNFGRRGSGLGARD
ncbi:MAG: TonB-dependent receptor [Terriglobia bacterium]